MGEEDEHNSEASHGGWNAWGCRERAFGQQGDCHCTAKMRTVRVNQARGGGEAFCTVDRMMPGR